MPAHVLEMRSGRLHVLGVDPDRPERVLPPDFGLREVLAASTDPAGVLDLMRTWGVLVAPGPDGPDLGLGACRERLRELQALARQVIALRDGDPAAECAAWSEVAAARRVGPPDLTTAREWLRDALERGLRPFGPRVLLSEEPPSAPDLFSAVALQLAHHLTGDTPLPRCGNDRCGRPFTVQRSPRRRDASSSHVAGVRYCQRSCAKAQSERDRRARRQAGAP